MKKETMLDRVEYWHAKWRGQPPKIYTDVVARAWLEPEPIPKKGFRVDVYVFCNNDMVLQQRLGIRELGAHKSMLASPLGVVLE